MDAKSGRPGLDGFERGEHLDVLGREADLLLGLAERRREEVAVAGLRSAAGQAQLASVDAVVGPQEEQDPENAVHVAEHRREHGRVPQVGTRGQTSGRRRSSTVSRRRTSRASPSPTSTAAGRVTPL